MRNINDIKMKEKKLYNVLKSKTYGLLDDDKLSEISKIYCEFPEFYIQATTNISNFLTEFKEKDLYRLRDDGVVERYHKTLQHITAESSYIVGNIVRVQEQLESKINKVQVHKKGYIDLDYPIISLFKIDKIEINDIGTDKEESKIFRTSYNMVIYIPNDKKEITRIVNGIEIGYTGDIITYNRNQ